MTFTIGQFFTALGLWFLLLVMLTFTWVLFRNWLVQRNDINGLLANLNGEDIYRYEYDVRRKERKIMMVSSDGKKDVHICSITNTSTETVENIIRALNITGIGKKDV